MQGFKALQNEWNREIAKTSRILEIDSIIVCIFALMMNLMHGEAVSAATYYVSPAGSDSNSGSISAPFRTIQKAANIVNPGDTAVVRNGTYTGGADCIAYLTRSGTAQNWITFKSENKWGAALDGQNFVTNYGFCLSRVSYVKIEDFEMKKIEFGGVRATSSSTNIEIYGNYVHDIGRLYIDPCVYEPGSHKAFSVDNTSTHITIDSNRVRNIGRLPGGAANCPGKEHYDYNQDHCVYTSASDILIKNNIFINCNAGWAISAYPGPINDLTIINNTFYGYNPQRSGHILLSGGNDSVIIQNNISYAPNSYFIQGFDSSDTNSSIKNNLVYGATLPNSACNYATCSSNIIGKDPRFVNLAGYDFHLKSDSPAIDKGIKIGARLFDVDGNAIVGAPDIGAYEYVGTSPIPDITCNTINSNSFFGCYYDNIDFTNLKLTRTDSQINFDWGSGPPNSSISSDTFSVRWQGYWNFAASGTYRFTATADDGIRIWVDGILILDKWLNQCLTTYTVYKSLSAGVHLIKVKYYKNGGRAVAKLNWVKN